MDKLKLVSFSFCLCLALFFCPFTSYAFGRAGSVSTTSSSMNYTVTIRDGQIYAYDPGTGRDVVSSGVGGTESQSGVMSFSLGSASLPSEVASSNEVNYFNWNVSAVFNRPVYFQGYFSIWVNVGEGKVYGVPNSSDGGWWQFYFPDGVHSDFVQYGIDFFYTTSGSISSTTLSSSSSVNSITLNAGTLYYGFKQNTDSYYVASAVSGYINSATTKIQASLTTLSNKLTTISDILTSQFGFVLSRLDVLSSNLKTYHTELLAALKQYSDDQIANDNKNHEDTTKGYDNSTASSEKDRLDSSIGSMENSENSLFESAGGVDVDYSGMEVFYTQIAQASSLVASIMQSIFVKSGMFGYIIALGFILLIVTRIIGYQNFTSGGG